MDGRLRKAFQLYTRSVIISRPAPYALLLWCYGKKHLFNIPHPPPSGRVSEQVHYREFTTLSLCECLASEAMTQVLNSMLGLQINPQVGKYEKH